MSNPDKIIMSLFWEQLIEEYSELFNLYRVYQQDKKNKKRDLGYEFKIIDMAQRIYSYKETRNKKIDLFATGIFERFNGGDKEIEDTILFSEDSAIYWDVLELLISMFDSLNLPESLVRWMSKSLCGDIKRPTKDTQDYENHKHMAMAVWCLNNFLGINLYHNSNKKGEGKKSAIKWVHESYGVSYSTVSNLYRSHKRDFYHYDECKHLI